MKPALSLQQCLERCQALRENAMRRSVDFNRAEQPAFAADAIREAQFFDSLNQHLQRESKHWWEHSQNIRAPASRAGADKFGQE